MEIVSNLVEDLGFNKEEAEKLLSLELSKAPKKTIIFLVYDGGKILTVKAPTVDVKKRQIIGVSEITLMTTLQKQTIVGYGYEED